MQTDFRYQLESKRLTGRQPVKLTCPHCHKKKCLVRYVDTRNAFQYVADTVGKCDHQHSCGYNISDSLETYPPNTDLCDLALPGP